MNRLAEKVPSVSELPLRLSPLPKQPKLSIVIPVYNELRWVEEILRRVSTANIAGCVLEMVVVNDASTDGTTELLETLAAKYPAMRLVHQKPNAGKGAAL